MTQLRTLAPVLIALVVGAAIQTAFTTEPNPSLAGSVSELGPLWPPYCLPSEAALERAAAGSDPVAWIFENAGDLVSLLLLAAGIGFALSRPPRVPAGVTNRLFGLPPLELLALAMSVFVFDIAYLISPRSSVAWEVASDGGLFAMAMLSLPALHRWSWSLAPAWLSRTRVEKALAASSAALCGVLVLGGFATALLPATGAAVGPRWPLLATLVCGQAWWLSWRRERESSPGEPHRLMATPSLIVALALTATAASLGLVEAAARWILTTGAYDFGAPSAPAQTRPRSTEIDLKSPDVAFELSRLVRPSPNPRLVYELRPDLRESLALPFLSTTRFRTNSHGLRGPEVAEHKSPGVARIAGLGDSVMFGWGVALRETHLAVLGQLLQERKAQRYQTLNFGVPGYNTVMERESFVDKARRFEPDWVVLTVVDNDSDLPNFLQRPRNPLCLHRAFLSGLLTRVVTGSDPYAAHEILVAQSYDFERHTFATDIGRTPAGSEALSGVDNALSALRRLEADVTESGAQLVVAIDREDLDAELDLRQPRPAPGLIEAFIAAAVASGIPVADPRERILDHLRAEGLRSKDLWVGPNDSHPDATRHRLMAEELAAVIGGLTAR